MGLFVAIEGGDGSGKGTQALELESRALSRGYNVLNVSFPNYGTNAAYFVEQYLNGRYGEANDVHPEPASLLYALDRYASSDKIRAHLRKPHSLVVANRYVASNLAHQGTKIVGKKLREKFYRTILQLEYETLNIPKPDFNILLLVPTKIAQSNIDQKPPRSYTPFTRDIHERDARHLRLANNNYRELTVLFPDRFRAVSCLESNEKTMRSVMDIGDDIWKIVEPLLV